MIPCAEEKKTTLHLSLSDECFARGKEDELFEVAVNLIKNAAEALPEGGVMTVTTRIEGNQVVFQVKDTGVGISRDDLGKVFDPFWSAKGLIRAGMGLSVSYGIVSRHGGTISVESELGKGSTFTVRLPLSDNAREKALSLPVTPPLRELTILAVDDSEHVLGFLRDVLSRADHTVLTALSGFAAIETFRDRHVDVVICDLGMPGMSGWEVGKEIREICRESSTGKPPFIMLTGWGAQVLEKDKITESGVDVVLTKPVEIAELLRVIQEVVCRNQQSRASS
jgi:CheY-like chemotaxis protein/anti-sigma regulatory factor (Ser/Thr protein kinase)